ncbi:hypothetical protein A8990_11022 [Paenibacillus taihuensis]|uniref:Uncharacterized protein n=1 Tax=Paenibacillus taihuensis TaxID=1156355 RepID=A0A3D9S1T7_9BACL|nr:hypothetical protein [Paenibacillus taihuensis]REE86414.1 hypothetical protein A8990_11022 [Paenibacillus taihuensis]
MLLKRTEQEQAELVLDKDKKEIDAKQPRPCFASPLKQCAKCGSCKLVRE